MSNSKYLRLLTIGLAFIAVLACAGVVQACPGCKESLAETDPAQSGMVKGYFFSILLMMGLPFTVIATFCGYMYLQVKQARAEQAARQAAEASERRDAWAAGSARSLREEREPVEV